MLHCNVMCSYSCIYCRVYATFSPFWFQMQWFSLSITLFSPLHYARQVYSKALFDVICIICFKWPNSRTGIHFLCSKWMGTTKESEFFSILFPKFMFRCYQCVSCVFFGIMMGLYWKCWMEKTGKSKYRKIVIVI